LFFCSLQSQKRQHLFVIDRECSIGKIMHFSQLKTHSG